VASLANVARKKQWQTKKKLQNQMKTTVKNKLEILSV